MDPVQELNTLHDALDQEKQYSENILADLTKFDDQMKRVLQLATEPEGVKDKSKATVITEYIAQIEASKQKLQSQQSLIAQAVEEEKRSMIDELQRKIDRAQSELDEERKTSSAISRQLQAAKDELESLVEKATAAEKTIEENKGKIEQLEKEREIVSVRVAEELEAANAIRDNYNEAKSRMELINDKAAVLDKFMNGNA